MVEGKKMKQSILLYITRPYNPNELGLIAAVFTGWCGDDR